MYKEGPNFSSINIIEFFVFPNVIIFGIPKSLNKYKLYDSNSKYNSELSRGSTFIMISFLSCKFICQKNI